MVSWAYSDRPATVWPDDEDEECVSEGTDPAGLAVILSLASLTPEYTLAKLTVQSEFPLVELGDDTLRVGDDV